MHKSHDHSRVHRRTHESSHLLLSISAAFRPRFRACEATAAASLISASCIIGVVSSSISISGSLLQLNAAAYEYRAREHTHTQLRLHEFEKGMRIDVYTRVKNDNKYDSENE
jgi:hypothetical protein